MSFEAFYIIDKNKRIKTMMYKPVIPQPDSNTEEQYSYTEQQRTKGH